MAEYWLFVMRVIFIFIFLFSPSLALSATCGNVFHVQYGPYDYRSESNGKTLRVVEKRHFTKRVEELISGESTSEIMADLHYTLNKFPNHYRALLSLIKYDLRLDGKLPQTDVTFTQSVECYFQRAIQFRDNDWRIYQVYGMYFYSNKKYQQAIDEFIKASALHSSAEVDYSIGISYFKIGDYNESKEFAIKAYSNGYPLLGLKNMLLEKGVAIDNED